jgi:hypothetical protein
MPIERPDAAFEDQKKLARRPRALEPWRHRRMRRKKGAIPGMGTVPQPAV